MAKMAEQIQLTVGSKAPDFTLQGTQGSSSLKDLLGEHNLLIYFVREFACHTCMGHAITLAKMQPEMSLTNTRTIMIGGGSIDVAKKTAERYKLPFPVFADPDRSVYQKYNLDKTMLVVQKSGTFLIDKKGIVSYANRASNPSASLDRIEILAAANKLSKSQ